MKFIALLVLLCLASCAGPSEKSIRGKAVKLSSARGSCSGEQVRAPSGVDYILTAGHCRVLDDGTGSITAQSEKGDILKRKIIAEDPNSDLLLLEGLPGVKGLPIASSVTIGEHFRTFTHGKGLDTYKTGGEYIQDSQVDILAGMIHDQESYDKCISGGSKYRAIQLSDSLGACLLSVKEMTSTAMVVPGSSGGMVVDDSGALCGVVSAADGSFGYFILLSDIQKFMSGY
jgi:hypothetical protein